MAQLVRLRFETTNPRLELRLGVRLQREQFLQFAAQRTVLVASRVQKGLALRRILEPARGIK